MANAKEEYIRTHGPKRLPKYSYALMATAWRKKGTTTAPMAAMTSDEHDSGNQQRPVARVGGAGIGDERDAGDDGGQQRHADCPAGD